MKNVEKTEATSYSAKFRITLSLENQVVDRKLQVAYLVEKSFKISWLACRGNNAPKKPKSIFNTSTTIIVQLLILTMSSGLREARLHPISAIRNTPGKSVHYCFLFALHLYKFLFLSVTHSMTY